MADKKSIFKAVSTYTLCNVLIRGISFLSTPLFIRLLTTEEFGRYNVFIAIESFLFVVSGLAIHSSIKNAFYDKKETLDNYIKNCVYLDVLVCLFLAIVFNLSCLLFPRQVDLSYTEANLLILSGFCQSVISIYIARIVMDYKSNEYLIITSISVIFGIALSLLYIFSFFDFNHYYGRIYGAVSGQMIAVLYICTRIFRTGFSRISISDIKYGLKISLPIVPHGVSQIILTLSDRIMIKYYYNLASAGIYGFTYTIAMIPLILFQSIDNVWEPWFFEKMEQQNYDSIRNVSNIYCAFMSLAFIAMTCVIPEVVRLLATPAYYEAIDISIIVVAGCYFATLYNIPCEIEYYYKKTSLIAISTVACAAINIILNFILMQHFSYKIAAYTSLISYVFLFIFHMIMAYKIMKRSVFDIRTMAITILLSCTAMLLIFLSIDQPLIRLTILVVSLIFCYQKFKLLKIKKNGSKL